MFNRSRCKGHLFLVMHLAGPKARTAH
jgi:hypothetical protein